MLPDIVAKIVQTTKTEQMIDTKHVQRVLGMMKAKNALMVLHNMSSLRNPKGFGFLSIIKKYYKYTRQKMKNHPETLLSIRAYRC